jgi:Uma2 family endonuclease
MGRLGEEIMVVATRRMTVAEFEQWQLSWDDSYRYDLWDGEVIEMAPANQEHGRVAMSLGSLVHVYAQRHRLGHTYAAETGFVLDEVRQRILAPDVAFVTRGRVPPGPQRGFFRGAPDLAVEVRSPSQSAREMDTKAEGYLAAGTRLVWIVDPDRRTVTVYRPNRSPEELALEGYLDGYDVLPGFRVAVAAIFDV